MNPEKVSLTLIDGPTLLLEVAGVRFLTDPTFDPPQIYPLAGGENLKKFNAPPVAPDSLLPIDAILLSHDQHMDNLDRAGRAFLPKAKRVISTTDAAERLGGNTLGLAPWANTTLPLPDGRTLTITATPARHGPVGIEPVTGNVIGFILSISGYPDTYVSGDTVWFEGVEEVSRRFNVGLAVLFTGSAQPRGPFNVTMNSNDAIEAATRFKDATIVAVHNLGWSHFVQSQEDLQKAFSVVGMNRFLRLQPAIPSEVSLDRGVRV